MTVHPRPSPLPLLLSGLAACSGAAPLPETGPAPDHAVSQSWSFDDAAAGRLPQGWHADFTGQGGDATWAVRRDDGALSPPQVLRLEKAASPSPVFNLALLREVTVADVDVAVSVRADTGRIDQGGGLVWRGRDAANYYICRLNPLEENFRVYKVVDGVRTQLHSADVDCVAGRWYRLRAVMVGGRIECYLDDVLLLAVADATFAAPGHVGLWTKADAATSFDDFRVTAAGR